MKSLKKAQRQFWRALILLTAFSFVVNMLLLAMPLYMLQIYDRILPSRSMDTLIFLSVIAAGALIVLGLLEAVRAIIASRAAAQLEVALGADALRQSMSSNLGSEAEVEPLRNLAMIRNFVSSRALFSLLDMPFAPIFIGILYIIHPTLFWLTLAGAVVLLIIAVINQRLIVNPSTSASHSQRSAMTMAQSLARNSDTMRAMGMMANGIRLWGQSNAENLVAQGSVDSRNAILTGFSRTLRMGLQIAILGVGALLVLNNEMTAGMIFAASIISGRGLQPIDQVIGGWKQFIACRQAWGALKASLSGGGDVVERTAMQTPNGHISVEGAIVMAPEGLSKAPILNRIEFALQPGDVLGVVGPSGSGKSTLARLLVGAQKPAAGHIRIDGTDVQNWEPAQLGQHIGYLGQDVDLLPGTVKENIARLSAEPDDLAVLEAAEKAQVHQLIQNLPHGYDTLIGPGGITLSGGQRQRIGLARAFYGNPQIMILDEPNANLDDDGELALHRAIVAAGKTGVTAVIITQRKQALNVVDKILRLHSGKIDFFGTREEFVGLIQKRRQLNEAAKAKVETKPVSPVVEANQALKTIKRPGSPFPPSKAPSSTGNKPSINPYAAQTARVLSTGTKSSSKTRAKTRKKTRTKTGES